MSRRSTSVAGCLRVALTALITLSAITFVPGSAAAAGTKTSTSDAYGFTVTGGSLARTSKPGAGSSEGVFALTAGPSGETTTADTFSNGPSSGPTGKIGSATKTPTPEEPAPTATKTPKPKATATKSPSKTTKSDPVLKGNVYTGTNKGYTVTFDKAVWNDVKVIEPDGTGYDGLDINSDDTLGSIEAIPTSLSLKDCLSESITAMGKTDGFSDVVEAPDLEKPATIKGVVNAMVTFVVTTDTGTVNITRYIECRTLVKGKSLLRIELAAGTVRATDVLPTWTDLIAGIKVAAAPGGTSKATATATPKPKTNPKATATPKSKKTPKASATTSANAFPDVVGDTFTSPAFGYTFTWPSKFTPLLASGDKSGDVIAVSDGTSSVLIFSKSTSDGTTVQSCLDDKETSLKASDTSTNVAVATDSANKDVRGKTSTGVYVLYSYTTDKGVDMYEYMRCDSDSKGTFILDLTFITPASAFTTSVDDIQAVLDGFLLP